MNRQTLGVIHSKTDGCCWYCGCVLPPFGEWQVEHQTPRAQRGGDSIDNLVPACRGCNAKKGNRTVEQYRHSLIVKLEHRVTEAAEFCLELSDAFGHDPTTWMPEELLTIHDRLREIADESTQLYLHFIGENIAAAQARNARLQPEAVIRSEGVS